MQAVRIHAELLWIEPRGEALICLSLRAPEVAVAAQPGQFVMLGPLHEAHQDPFLNRPFSIHRVTSDGCLDLLVAVVGRVTGLMAGWTAGRRIGLLGPLGRGFAVPDQADPLILVGGGVGVAPLFFLAEHRRSLGKRCCLLYGAAAAGRLVSTGELRAGGCTVELATDDGSSGRHGFVTELLREQLQGMDDGERGRAFVAACGPEPMLRVVAGLCRSLGVAAQVSLENRMACGTGACMGCAEWVAGRPQRVCVEGPVFDAAEVFE